MIYDCLRAEELLLPEGIGFSPEKVAQRNAKTSKAIELALSARQCSPVERLRMLGIDWQWVYGYGPRCGFRPGASGKPCYVRGPNASGKSSFNDIVGLALFGQEPGKAAASYVVNVGKPEGVSAWIEASCAVGDAIFRIRREFEVKSGKLVQTATVLEDTGAVVAAGRSGVSEWIGRFVTLEDFSLLDRRDADVLAMKPADQKAILDGMCRSEAFRADTEAVRESSKAFKWMAGALESARDALLAAGESDPDDCALSSAMGAIKEAGRAVTLCRSQVAFANAAAASAKARASVALAGSVPEDAVPRRVPASELSDLLAKVVAARAASESADARLWDSNRQEPRRPPEVTEDSVYLLEKTERYREADGLFRAIRSSPGVSPFDPGCWACVARHGADFEKRESAERRLAAMSVGDAREVAAKLKGYESRLRKATDDDTAARVRSDWAAGNARARLVADEAAMDLRVRSIAYNEARVAGELFELGMTPSELRGYTTSRLPSTLKARMRILISRQNACVATASELKALRKRANAERASAGRLSVEAEECLARVSRLKELQAVAASKHDAMYHDAVADLSRSANAVLDAAYGIEISGEWTGSSVIFRFANAIPVEKASGFERAVISLALKAALRELGHGASCGWMVIDEATSGFDDANAGRLSIMIDRISALGVTVIALVSSGNSGESGDSAILTTRGGHRYLDFIRT